MSDLFPNFFKQEFSDQNDKEVIMASFESNDFPDTPTEQFDPSFLEQDPFFEHRDFDIPAYSLSPNFLDGMNEAQKEAVLFEEGSLLVLSGAGSGKTRVISHRFAHLVSKYHLQLKNILCVTFTNKAAAEMKGRILDLLSLNSRDTWIKTFHSMCVTILKVHAEKIGYSKDFTIFDASDTRSSIKKIFEQLRIDPKQYSEKAIMRMISSAKDSLISPRDFFRTAQGELGTICAEVYQEYQKVLRNNQAMDFSDLIANALVLLQEESQIREFYQNQWNFIMADEFQDTNKSQYLLLKLLSRNLSNVCVVGDDDQSIYGWRGAQVTNIRQFQDEFKAQIIRLETNYRSSGNIVKAASAVVDSIDGRMPKTLKTSRSPGEKIIVSSLLDDRVQAAYIYNEIKTLVENKGHSYKDFAILYRTNAQSRILEEVFTRHQVPYRIYGGQRFFDRAEIKDLLAYLRVIVNPNDSEAFARIVNVPRRKIGDASQDKIHNFTHANQLNFITASQRASEIQGLNRTVVQALELFSQTLGSLHEQVSNANPSFILKQILDKIEYFRLHLLVEYGDKGAEDRMSNIEELLNAMKIFEDNNPSGTVIDFLQEASLLSDSNESEEERDNCLSLMTIHSSKGLEFDIVFLIGLVEGILPMIRSGQSDRDIDEEKRLFYVAVTRAKNQLYLSHEERSLRYGEMVYNKPSHFFDFLPQDILVQKKQKKQETFFTPLKKHVSSRQTGSVGKQKLIFSHHKTEKIKSLSEIQVGNTVCHAIFGLGTVDYVSNAMIKVVFENFGTQVLMGNVTLNLEKVII